MEKNNIWLDYCEGVPFTYCLSKKRKLIALEIQPINENYFIGFTPLVEGEGAYYIRRGGAKPPIIPSQAEEELSKIEDGKVILYFDDGSVDEFKTTAEFWNMVKRIKR